MVMLCLLSVVQSFFRLLMGFVKSFESIFVKFKNYVCLCSGELDFESGPPKLGVLIPFQFLLL